jgi:hypothetical protein
VPDELQRAQLALMRARAAQKQLALLTPVEINIERPDGLLVDWLVGQVYAVFVTAPRAAASYRPRSSKDDRNDARLLAN